MTRARILLLAFLTGAAVMVAEIVAPRLVAPHLGTTALVWTTVIATFLGGIAIGNAWGGRLADAGRPMLLPLLLLAAAGLTAATIPLDGLVRSTISDPGLPLAHPLRILGGVPIAFLPASVLLGTAAPFLARAALRAGRKPGRSLGAVAAAGAAGSVAGTFLAGFVLTPLAGTRAILLATAGALVGCAVLSWRLDPPGATPRAAPRAPAGAPASTPMSLSGYGVLAALVGGVLLSLEIAVGRMGSDVIGNSIYTWTSVIGVVLVGLAAGNALGGRLADRYAAKPLLSALLLAASAAIAACLWTRVLMKPILGIEALSWPLRTLLAITAGFLLPAVAIGTLSPVLVRAALLEPKADGRIVGRLYALGSLGAVAGAALAGFVLIPGRGVTILLVLLAFVLALAQGRVRGKQEIPWLVMLAVLAGVAVLPIGPVKDLGLRLGLREDHPGWYVEDSEYFRIRVQPTDDRSLRLSAEPKAGIRDHPAFEDRAWFEAERRVLHWRGRMSVVQTAALRNMLGSDRDREALDRFRPSTDHDLRILVLDKLVHGFVDLQDPTWLGYDYERLYAAVVKRLWPRVGGARAFFIGGGSYTFQRRLVALHGKNVACVSAEIDPGVTRAAELALGLKPGAAGEIWHGDARTWVRSQREWTGSGYTFAFGDAFNDLSVPWHLTTVEFARDLKNLVRPSYYVINVIDTFESGRFLGAFLRTLEDVFRNVRVLSVLPRNDDAQDTFVLVASDLPLDLEALVDDDGRPLDAHVYGAADLATLRARPGPPLLTDDHAPVEWLLAPVVKARGRD